MSCSHGRRAASCWECAREILLTPNSAELAVEGLRRDVLNGFHARDNYIHWLEERVETLEANLDAEALTALTKTLAGPFS